MGSWKPPVSTQNEEMEQKFHQRVFVFDIMESAMQAAMDRVMKTYGMLVNLTAQQEQAAREKVSSFLANAHTDDENKLAIEGLRYLRTSFREHNR
jgi:molybdopterin-biosynthesis enzyme MoeA-like protein